MLLLPFQAGGQVIRAAGLFVNPGLEEVWLSQDASGWHPHLESSFAAAGLTCPADGIPIRNPAAGRDRPSGPDLLTAGITGRIERYTCDAQPEILAAAAQHGGFVFIATHAADPDQLTPAGLMHAFASPMTLAGWAPL